MNENDLRQIADCYPLAGRKPEQADTVIRIGRTAFGGGHFAVIGGPCAVESATQINVAAGVVRSAGAGLLRGGVYKPRTSPYSYQGIGEKGIAMLVAAGRSQDLPVVSEITAAEQIPFFAAVDVLQVGARNMQNYALLQALAACRQPILLKRGLSATLQELLFSAEYLLAGGNPNVILCERGIRTYDTITRNTLDLAAVPLLKKLSHLPVIVDPSHGTGIRSLVLPMSLAAAAAGADGLLLEMHPDPEQALSDGEQSLNPDEFRQLMAALTQLRSVTGKQTGLADDQ